MGRVVVERKPIEIPTYRPGVAERNPLFFEKRVYQGSSGKVYPVPFVDKVHDTPAPVAYDSIEMDNGLVNLLLLPEIGGRIFRGRDLTNGGYDFFYRQDVVKPALVGLAGPWISGGVEFNWPQHHRPGTYLPTDVHLEESSDGARTAWLSEHDPLQRMKGMHGVCLRPDSALIELRVRLFNRTPFTQTFLWWANVAARVHDRYQSFFPADVQYVADHAVRAQMAFPTADGPYYGVDYAARPGANDLSWYRNIPVPTSYMVCETRFDFFGGYDHEARAGFVHVADRHIAPGKKQWTWGNHAFGWAWDRELTDTNGPYVELMAGVYTDNQPDFTYLAPYETRTFSQFWWPYQEIGPVQNASQDAAIRLAVLPDKSLELGVAVSRPVTPARIRLREGDRTLMDLHLELRPGSPWMERGQVLSGDDPCTLELSVSDVDGQVLCVYRPVDQAVRVRRRPVAVEPPPPSATGSNDELVLTAEHLEQVRHPTRSPEPYLEEALLRDPGDARANIALGRRRLQQGLFAEAAGRFEAAIARLTMRHPNPYTGEAHYLQGLVRRFQAQFDEAYTLFYKATWDDAWRSAAYFELALIDSRRRDWAAVARHCEAALDTNRQNHKAGVLQSIALRHLGGAPEALLIDLLAEDPLDHWARVELGDLEGFLERCRNDAQTVLDVAYDYADAGLWDAACSLLSLHHEREVPPVAVPNPSATTALTWYALAWVESKRDAGRSWAALETARALSPDYLFPSRVQDARVLEWALGQTGPDRNAAYGLGNLLYDRRRHTEAIAAWQRAVDADPGFATAHRCLGIARWNVECDGAAARKAYWRAMACAPTDARILAEYDQLCGKLGDAPQDRLALLLERRALVLSRDDATVSLCALYNETGQPGEALALLASRRFHPWEGGEGQVLRQYTQARLLLGQADLERGDAAAALAHFEGALRTPPNLGEAYHLLQAKADVNYWRGKALRALGRESEACEAFEAAADETGDFQDMAVKEYSEQSVFRGLSLRELGRDTEADALFEAMQVFVERELAATGEIDYFATSLPLLLVFEDDLTALRHRNARRLAELAARHASSPRR